MTLELREPFKSLWANEDPFVAVERLQGEVFRELEARRTLRTEVDGKGYFVKIHRGVGWREILKNLATAKRPVLGAGQEWAAIQRLTEVGVPTMHAVAFGERGSNPAEQHSFIVTEELAPTISLEDYTRDWLVNPPRPRVKWALIREVARMTREMHAAGVNHRDCYICHYLLHTDRPVEPGSLKISLIDLHRAQVRDRVPLRWRDKDLAGLYFSSMGIGLTQKDIYRFLRVYFDRPLQDLQLNDNPTFTTLRRKADKLIDRKERYGGAL